MASSLSFFSYFQFVKTSLSKTFYQISQTPFAAVVTLKSAQVLFIIFMQAVEILYTMFNPINLKIGELFLMQMVLSIMDLAT